MMKSRGPNVTVLHLRSTSEPWTITDTGDDNRVLNNINSTFAMDYENFLKNYERDSEILTNGRDITYPEVKATMYSPVHSIRKSSTVGEIFPSSGHERTNQRTPFEIEIGDIPRNKYEHLIKSQIFNTEDSKKYSADRKRTKCNSKSNIHFNYPLICPPPGFEDELLQNGNLHAFSDHSPDHDTSTLLTRLEKFSLDEQALKNQDLYRKLQSTKYKQNNEEFNAPYHKSDSDEEFRIVAYPTNSRRSQSIDNYNCISGHPHEVRKHSFLNSSPRHSRSIKSCSEFGTPKTNVAHCQWCNSSVIPKRSYSAGNAQYYYECNCYHCGATLPSVTPINGAVNPGQRDHINFADEREIRNRQNYLPQQNIIRRSASFQSGQTNPQFSTTAFNDISSNARVNKKPIYMTYKNEFDEFPMASVGLIQDYNGMNYCTPDCIEDDGDDGDDDDDYDDQELFYECNNDDLQKCTCALTKNVDRMTDFIETIPIHNNELPKLRTFTDRYKECYPATHTDITEVLNLNPPDIANVKSSMDLQSNYNHCQSDVEFIRKQPDILQSAYYGKRTRSTCSETTAKNYLFSNPAGYNSPRRVIEHKKKACSLPKSFQRQVELEKLNNNIVYSFSPTRFYNWRKYGFKRLFLNRKTALPVSIMSETAPTTPVKDMPEKKKYSRLMKIGQYSSSPALDDDHTNFDCDTRDKFKINNAASMNVCDFRPSSQENIVTGDGVFHKFCKSFSLRFLRKASEHEVDGIPKNEFSNPSTEKSIDADRLRLEKSGPLPLRSNSERSRRINTPNNKLRLEKQISTHLRVEEKNDPQLVETQQCVVRRTLSDLNRYSSNVGEKAVSSMVPSKQKLPVTVMTRKYKQCSLRRSASQPLINIKYSSAVRKKSPPCSEDERALFSEDDMMSDSGGSSLPSRKNSFEKGLNEDIVIVAEAVWDHVAIESEELPFQAGDVIEVYNVLDREWWWGMCNGKSGWFPSDFVRLRVNQEESLQSHMSESPTKQNTSLSSMTNDHVRSKIISELLNTERDFVKILNDVQEAFVSVCQETKELFSNDQVYKIFGNWEQIASFQTMFLENLEANFNEQCPYKTCVGECFLKFRDHFCIYSDYCNNHPLSIATLQQLYEKEEYKNFFESCRMKRNLIAIPLDGFLLTPIQRICKYPLQLAELLKHTEPDHNDHRAVEDALNAMREVAILINERKRRMESLEKLILWQQRVDGWDGNNLIENSSQLIHQNDVTKVFAGMWTTNVTLFLFDHQLVFCKKDILKRDFYVYKGRISLDGCEIIGVPDGKDSFLGINIRNSIRIQNIEKNKWLLFCCRTQREKQDWINVFQKEKELVLTDERNKLKITQMDRKLAYITATTCNNRHAFLKHKNKKLKRSINHAGQLTNPNSPHILGRKVGTWFMFGANRKNHRRFISKNHSTGI